MKSVSDDKPNVFQNLGNGSWFYNYDFKEVDQPQEVDQENVPVKKSWECESVKVWGIPTSKTVKNDNKRFELGISEDKTLQDKYIAYLNKVEEIKQMVESDFLNYSGQLIQ